MKSTRLEILDEVNVKFHNIDAVTRRKMVEALRFFIPQAVHTPAYKLGRWDGYVSYCTLGGLTQLNLLDSVLPVIVDAGYDITIDDTRKEYGFEFEGIEEDWFAKQGKVWPKGHPAEGEPVMLRDYQVKVINTFLEEKQCMQEVATSAGKTLITAALSSMVEKYGRSLVIVPSKSLVVQTEEDYKNLGLDVGVYYGDRKEGNHTHVICTWQSVEQLIKKGKDLPDDEKPINELIDDLACVIVDEAHGAKAQSLRTILTTTLSFVPLRFGLTGTIPKEEFNFFALLGSIGPVTNRLTANELQEKGVISKCHIEILQYQEHAEFANYQQEHKYLTSDKERFVAIAERLYDISQTGNTLILVDRIESGEMLAEMIAAFQPEGAPEISVINGSIKVSDRKKEYEEVATSSNKIIIATYGVAAVGINIPRIFNLVLIEAGKSFVRVIQSIGRGIRKAKDKDFVQIWDVCASTKHSRRHLAKRKEFYNDAKYPHSTTKVKYK